MTMPYEMLNRAGRRMRAALTRKMPYTRIREIAQKETYLRSQSRSIALETHLDKVTAATKLRKGKINNPRFQ